MGVEFLLSEEPVSVLVVLSVRVRDKVGVGDGGEAALGPLALDSVCGHGVVEV